MESSGDKFVDHKETIISVPRPRQLNALKVDITPEEAVQEAESFEAGFSCVLTKVPLTVSKSDEKKSSEDNENRQGAGQETSSKGEWGNESATTSVESQSVIVQESSTESKDSSSTKKYATTVYTQRISGRKSRSSDSGGEISSPTAETSRSASSFGSTSSAEVHSPTQICSVQFNVAAGAAPCTTTAFSKMFTKTVEASTEVISKERHLSECSFSIGGSTDKLPSQETDLNHSQEKVDDESVFTEDFASVKPEEEKEVAEYSPGLAIRTLTLEDLQEKQLTPERETGLNDTPLQTSTDMSTSLLTSTQSSTVSQDRGFFSAYAESAVDLIPMPADVSQRSGLASEYNTSQLLASESSTSELMSQQSSSLTSGGQILMQCTDDTVSSLRKPLFNPIEVERKFTMTETTEEQLRSLGARLHKEKTFTDVYYDNDKFTLIVSDCWLRRRNDSWEAKVPLKPQKDGAIFSPASQYKEISNEREISRWLVDHLGLDRWMRGDPIDLLVQAAGLTEFAKFNTTRRSYTLPSCMVDLDLTDNGFQVGEIDVMAASPEELPQALQTISHVAAQLGLKERNKSPSQTKLCLLLLNLHVFSMVISRTSFHSPIT